MYPPGVKLILMFADRRQRLINFGYYGHMWELYAFWTWLPTYLTASLTAWRAGAGGRVTVGVVAFAAIRVARVAGALTGAADARYVGTALTAQIAIGFLITITTIRLLPIVAGGVGWRWALSVLALGPLSGVLAMRGLLPRGADRDVPA